MKTNIIPPALLVSCVPCGQRQSQRRRSTGARGEGRARPPVAEQALKTQVMLDRAGYSPGEIDAAMGTSTQKALDAFTKNGGNAAALPSGRADDISHHRSDAAGRSRRIRPT